jgi:tRNA(Ile)-lysidine synthase
VLDRFKQYIEKNTLFQLNEKVLLAVSGGIDSMVMANLFLQAGYKFALAHCNFQLRGDDSDLDEILVEKLAKVAAVDCFVKRFDTIQFSRSNRLSIQMAARQLRYDWFEEIRLQSSCSHIATAHHMDDHTETVLANIIRGTGMVGLRGIWPKRNKIIRPLWPFTRKEILQFAEENNITFREDSSNKETKYTRNKIRHKILPLINEINPSFNESIGRLSKIAEDSDELLRFLIRKEIQPKKVGHNHFINIPTLLSLPSKEIVLFELLKEYDFKPEVVTEISLSLNGQAGKVFYSATHVCLKDRHDLVVSPINRMDRDDVIWIEKDVKEVQTSAGSLHFSSYNKSELIDFKTLKHEVLVDADKLNFPLSLRHPVEGDFFFPFGMSGKKKVSDYLTDMKIALTDKSNVWLLCCGKMIVWIVGMRSDERFRVNDATQIVLKISITPINK